MAKKKFYDAAVYSILSKKTGDRYIGASSKVTKRLASHMSFIRLGTHVSKRVRRAFSGHKPEDLELKILQRVEIEITTWPFSEEPQRFQLSELERLWIRKLKPSLNVVGALPRVGKEIQILEPDESCQLLNVVA